MMIKKLIRENIREILKGKTAAGDDIFFGRTAPTWIEELPVILIYSDGEGIARHNQSPKSYRREYNIVIECVNEANSDAELEDNLDALGDEVERLLELDETLDGSADSLELVGTNYRVESDGQSPVGALILRYAVLWYGNAISEKDMEAHNFNVGNFDWQVGHHDESPQDDVIDAIDIVDLT